MSSHRPPPGLALVAAPAASLPARVFYAALALVPAPRARRAPCHGRRPRFGHRAAWRIPARPVALGPQVNGIDASYAPPTVRDDFLAAHRARRRRHAGARSRRTSPAAATRCRARPASSWASRSAAPTARRPAASSTRRAEHASARRRARGCARPAGRDRCARARACARARRPRLRLRRPTRLVLVGSSPRKPPLWCAHSRAYRPPCASSVRWSPSSTMRPRSSTISRSIAAIVDSRCAIATTVLPSISR